MKLFVKMVLLAFVFGVLGGCSDDKKTNVLDLPYVEPPTCPQGDDTGGFHVTLEGTAQGDGSLEAPWDLATALNDPPGVAPGDTVWIHGGRYVGTFVVKQDGEEDAPITIRGWPGERVTLDSAGATDEPVVQIYRRWTILRDLEITNSGTDRRSDRPTGIYVGGNNITLVNLTVHDVGVGISGGRMAGDDTQEGTNIRVHGCLVYNNGWSGEDRGHGHNFYLTNRDGFIKLEENIVFYAYGFGVHNYSYSDTNYVENNELYGNVWFLNGAPGGKLYDNCMVGHDGTRIVRNTVLYQNYGWVRGLGDRDVRLGWDTANEDALLVENYFVGQTIFQDQWSGIEMTDNTFIGDNSQGGLSGLDAADYADNTYIEGAPANNAVFIRPNGFEPGRAHIIVYNWEGLEEVAVDLSEILPSGVEFELRNAQNFYDDPVVSGTYSGGSVTLPMTGLSPAEPIGDPGAFGEHLTGRDFNAFVLRAAVCD